VEKVHIEDIGLQYVSSNKRRYQACIVECPTCKSRRTVTKTNFESCKSTKCNTCKHLKHGESKSQLYKVHTSIKQRCENKNSKHYEYYGGRGIKVCTEWEPYEKFKVWALSNGYESSLTIDRKDNNKGYNPDNCRWTTRKVQSRNTRVLRKGNTSGYRGVTYEKRTKKWDAKVTVDSKSVYIGVFPNKEEAAAAYNNYVTANKLEHTLTNLN
jgi:hypothetical protein